MLKQEYKKCSMQDFYLQSCIQNLTYMKEQKFYQQNTLNVSTLRVLVMQRGPFPSVDIICAAQLNYYCCSHS